MSFTSIDISVRPIKLAILVDYNDKTALLKAISINSVLWGGLYNPIIPIYKRLPNVFKKDVVYKFHSKKDIFHGYIETFDADYVINLSSLDDKDIPVPDWRVITENDIFDKSTRRKKAAGRAEVNYGTGIFEVLDHVQEKEFKYVRNVPLEVLDIQFTKRNELFLGSVFGLYSERVRPQLVDRYKDTMPIKARKIGMTDYTKTLTDVPLTLLELCNSYIEILGNGGPRDNFVFLMDSSNWQDVVDFINLRALGLNVLPIPLQISSNQEVIDLTSSFIINNYRKYNDNNVYYSTNLLSSRNVSESDLQKFGESLEVPREKAEIKWAFQSWYPRIWEGWQNDRSGLTGNFLEHQRATYEASDSNDISIPQLKPSFIDDYHHFWKPKYANDISVRTYGSNDYIANAFPTGIDNANQVLGKYASNDEWRFSRRGIVYLPDTSRGKITFKLPSAEKLYDQWQSTKGINAITSPPGKLARQIVKKMGVEHINVLAIEEFAKLIQKLSSTKGLVQSIAYDKLWGQIQQFTQNTMWFSPQGYFDWLLHKRVLELGADIVCENCGDRSWHDLKSIESVVQCHVCAEKIEVGISDPRKQIIWSYRPVGPFMVPDLSQGAYTVVLALNFFADTMKMNITPRYSFNSADGKYEADLGVLIEPQWHWGGGIAYVIGECKSFGYKNRAQFSNAEVSKLVKLAKKDKNSTILFATLSSTLTTSDKTRLKKLIYKLRESRFKGKKAPDVLILTGNELFAERSLRKSWSGVSEKHKEFSEKSAYYSLQELCDATQQLYLEVESYWEWFDRKRNELGEDTSFRVA